MRIMIKEAGSVISDLIFEQQPIQIGSQSDCDIHLPDMRVAAHHALLTPLENGQWIIQHQADSAKTMVNGHLLRNSMKLANGDQIAIEDYTLNVYLDLGEQKASETAGTPEPTLAEEFPVPRGTKTKAHRHDISLAPDALSHLSRFALELSACGDISSLMEAVLTSLARNIPSRAVWIGVRRQGKGPLEYIQGRDFNNQIFDLPKLYASLAYRCLDRGLSVLVPRLDDADTDSLIAAPLISSSGRLGFIYLDTRKDQDNFGESDLDHLISLASIIAIHLDVVISDRVRVRKAVSSAEWSIVRAIQAKLDPKSVPEWPDLQIALHCQPGQTDVGDIYDVMQLPNGAAALLTGHVTASSASAAITLVEVRTAFRIAVIHADMPHVMMRQLNWLLCDQTEKITMQCAVVLVDPKTGALLYCFAGQPCAMIIGLSGQPRPVGDTYVPALGTMPNYEYKTRKGLLGKQESLAMYTPGVLKLTNVDGEELDESRFIESLCDGVGMPARTALDETLSDLNPYLTGGNLPSDITILLSHRPG